MVIDAAGRVDERTADKQADRLEAERDRPGRAADPTQQRVRRVGRPQRDVHDQDHGLGDPGDDGDRQQDGDLDGERRRPAATGRGRGSRRSGPRRRGPRPIRRALISDPVTVPTPYAARMSPSTNGVSPRSRVTWTVRARTSGASRIEVAPQNRIALRRTGLVDDVVDPFADLGHEPRPRAGRPARAGRAGRTPGRAADSHERQRVDGERRARADRRGQDPGDGRADDVARSNRWPRSRSSPGRPGRARRASASTPCSRPGRTSGGCSSAPPRAG